MSNHYIADKFRFWKSPDFRNDYLLHYYPKSTSTDVTEGLVFPEKMIQILEKREWNYSHKPSNLDLEYNCPWINLQDGGKFIQPKQKCKNLKFFTFQHRTPVGTVCHGRYEEGGGTLQTETYENIPGGRWNTIKVVFPIDCQTPCRTR